jgi:hypothetical protein
VPDLSAFSSLRLLELSYNAIHSLAPLKACGATRLEELYAASNKVSEAGPPPGSFLPGSSEGRA